MTTEHSNNIINAFHDDLKVAKRLVYFMSIQPEPGANVNPAKI